MAPARKKRETRAKALVPAAESAPPPIYGVTRSDNSWIKKVSDAFTDLTDIRVVTLTGKITFENQQDAGEVKLQDLIGQNINTNDVQIMMATNISLIGKTTLVISSSPGPTENMMLAHNAAVDVAKETRTAICNLIKDVVVEAANMIKQTVT